MAQPREKLLQTSAMHLEDKELLALFLQTGLKNMPVTAYADSLLHHFGGLTALLDTPITTLLKTKGLGVAKSAKLKAITEISKRYHTQKLQLSNIFNNQDSVQQFLLAQFSHAKREIFATLFLDNQLRLIEYKELFYGTIDQVTVHPREIMTQALLLHANAIILVHNHPSGQLVASDMDIALTKQIKKISDLLEIKLIDHFIVSNNRCISMAEAGLI